MKQLLTTLSVLALLAACGDGNPFPVDEPVVEEEEEVDGGEEPEPGEQPDDVLDTGTVRPPLSDDLEARGDIVRAEALNDENGGGQLASVIYDAATDTMIVDGLGFDGENVYQRGQAVSQLNGYAVYDADLVATDSVTGDPIDQIVPYRAVYGVSQNSISGGEPRTSFAIVRTGGYVQYGFGGFIYGRSGDVELPTTGQAVYSGDYAGVRVFTNTGGLEYTEGDMTIAIDFNDFNTNDAVQGEVTNRVAFDVNGDEIALGGDGQLVLPDLRFVIEAGGTNIQSNGEFSGELQSLTVTDTGEVETYESGTYYAVLAGDNTAGDGGEVVGIIVVESDDPRFENVTAQETGGFILYRGTGN